MDQLKQDKKTDILTDGKCEAEKCDTAVGRRTKDRPRRPLKNSKANCTTAADQRLNQSLFQSHTSNEMRPKAWFCSMREILTYIVWNCRQGPFDKTASSIPVWACSERKEHLLCCDLPGREHFTKSNKDMISTNADRLFLEIYYIYFYRIWPLWLYTDSLHCWTNLLLQEGRL